MTVLDLLKDLLNQMEALVESNLKLERRLGSMNGVSYKAKRGPGRPRGSGKKASTATGKKRGRKSRFTAEMIADIKKARANGTSVAELAKTHKASGPTIYALLRK
ncbi:MAG: hypothetical protein ACLPJH_19820 [Myxococcaceae bacterium]